jgi:hypothetical protein
LDSRAIWIEQQLHKSCVFPRDNLYVGPGEYNPEKPESHISSPILKPPFTADDFHPYRSHTSGSHKTRGVIKKPYQLSTDCGGLDCTRTEFASLFHDHDKRIAIDPSRRYYITQKPFLPQDEFLAPIMCDGRREPSGSIVMKENYQRPPLKPALPEYDPQYESKQLRSVPKYGSIARVPRPELFPPSPDYSLPEGADGRAPRAQSPPPKNSFKPIRRNKFKISQPKIIFNASSYERARRPAPPTLSPSFVNNAARVHVFHKAVVKPQSYQSPLLPSALGERIKKNSM